jgi:hypothetical protein
MVPEDDAGGAKRIDHRAQRRHVDRRPCTGLGDCGDAHFGGRDVLPSERGGLSHLVGQVRPSEELRRVDVSLRDGARVLVRGGRVLAVISNTALRTPPIALAMSFRANRARFRLAALAVFA